MPERPMEQNGAMPTPVAIKTGGRSDGLNVKYPRGPTKLKHVPILAVESSGVKTPSSIK